MAAGIDAAVNYYINPNTRSLTSNINNTKIKDKEAFSFMFDQLTPVEDIEEALKENNKTDTYADGRTKNQIAHMSSYYLKNTTTEVKSAWQKTLEETGINPFANGYPSGLVQLATEQDFAKGGNDDIFGSTMESTIDAVNKILDRVENQLDEVNETFLQNEKTFYTTLLNFLQRTGQSENVSNTEEISAFAVSDDEDVTPTDSLMEMIAQKKEEIIEKLKNGDTEEKIQIGGAAFTKEEWEKLLGKVDDFIEEVKEKMKEEVQKQKEQAATEEQIAELLRNRDMADGSAVNFGNTEALKEKAVW